MALAAYPTVAPEVPYRDYVGLQNQRLQLLASQLARLQRLNVRSVSAATTLTENDDVLKVDTTGGSVTVTLPDAALNRGKVFFVKKMVAANNVVLDRTDTIDGAASNTFATQYQTLMVVSDGTNWLIV